MNVLSKDFWVGRYNEFGWLQVIAVWAVIGALVVIACAWSTDAGGREIGKTHSGSVPAGVVEVDRDLYVVASGSGQSLDRICYGDGSTEYDNSAQPLTIGDFKGEIYRCVKEQTWNDHGNLSPNFGGSLLLMLKNPAWAIPALGPITLFLLFCALVAPFNLYGRRKQRKVAKMNLKQAARELTASWAKDEVEDVDYYLKMDKLYKQGLTAATDQDASLTKGN